MWPPSTHQLTSKETSPLDSHVQGRRLRRHLRRTQRVCPPAVEDGRADADCHAAGDTASVQVNRCPVRGRGLGDPHRRRGRPARADPSPGRAGSHRRALHFRRGRHHAPATRPEPVSGIVEINPFTRKVPYSLGAMLRVRRYRRGVFLLTRSQLFGSLGLWLRYLNLAYPAKPADCAG